MSEKENVLVFLESLKFYLYGDLNLFEKLCNDAEGIESLQTKIQSRIGDTETPIDNNTCNKSNVESPITSSAVVTTTTTTETTKSPSHDYVLKSEPLIFRSTIPHILTIFSTIDLVGFLLGNLNMNEPTTTKNVKKFFCDLEKPSEKEIEFLTLIYRHGMSHTYFPKKQLGIKAHSSNPKSELFFVEMDVIVLNANYLIELTKNRLESVLINPPTIINMENQFQKLIKHDESIMVKEGFDIEKFKLSLPKI